MIHAFEFWLFVVGACCAHWLLPSARRQPFLAIVSACYLCSLSLFSGLTITVGAVFLRGIWDQAPSKLHAFSRLHLTVSILLAWMFFAKPISSLLTRVLAADSPLVAIGVSYYVFRLIHYSIERSRGNLAQVGWGEYFCWIFWFPILTAGPIEQLDHFSKNQSRTLSADDLVNGLCRIGYGLVKKFVVADIALRECLMRGHTVSWALEQVAFWPSWKLWIFFAFLFLYFYIEFSAYSDIAIGISRLFGIKIIENFNWPILSTSISEFWKRWHMSLAGFCQRYVYMPVIARTRNPYVAIFATFLAMGMWHSVGVNYLLWAFYHAIGVSCALTFQRFKRVRAWQQPTGLARYWGLPVTFTFLTVSGIFSGTTELGPGAIWKFALGLVGLGRFTG